ncbi:15419_t:CDS:2, partial [Racocetra fulgida]
SVPLCETQNAFLQRHQLSRLSEFSPLIGDYAFNQRLRLSPGVLSFARDFVSSRGSAVSPDAMVGPRFEQTDLEVQPNSVAAIDLIAEEPIHYVEGRIAICDGGI